MLEIFERIYYFIDNSINSLLQFIMDSTKENVAFFLLFWLVILILLYGVFDAS
jgi:hypothetical protein